MNDGDGGPFLDNATALEHYLADAIAHYRLPAPWGCVFGFLRSITPIRRTKS